MNSKGKMLDAIKYKTGLTLEELNKGDHNGRTTVISDKYFFSCKIIPVIFEFVPEVTKQIKKF